MPYTHFYFRQTDTLMYDRFKAISDAISDAASAVKDKSQQVAGAIATQAEDTYHTVRATLQEKFGTSGVQAGQAAHTITNVENEIEEAARRAVPVIWMLGKTGAGKTSVIAALTGSPHAEVGTGYKPCTQHARTFDFPDETPLLRFLDTRGLGEAGYDPAPDIAASMEQADLVVVVISAADQSPQCLLDAIAQIRADQPEMPVLVLQTCLHEHYPSGGDHPSAYPFDGSDADFKRPEIPPKLRNALTYQRRLFSKLKGKPPKFVAVDFTQPDDGFSPLNYGQDALINGLLDVAPEAVRLLVRLEFQEKGKSATGSRDKTTHRHILYWAGAAATVGAAPVVGLLTVPAAQAAMLAHLGKDYGVEWTVRDASALAGLLGLAVVANQGMLLMLRQVAKLGLVMIPVAAIQDYAVTYALGCAARVYLGARVDCTEAKAEEVRTAFYNGLLVAFQAKTGGKP